VAPSHAASTEVPHMDAPPPSLDEEEGPPPVDEDECPPPLAGTDEDPESSLDVPPLGDEKELPSANKFPDGVDPNYAFMGSVDDSDHEYLGDPEDPFPQPLSSDTDVHEQYVDQEETSKPPEAVEDELSGTPELLSDLRQVEAAEDFSDDIGNTSQEVDDLDSLEDDFLDVEQLKKKLSKVNELEGSVKEKENQFDQLLDLMMKKEVGEITNELFMEQLVKLKKKSDDDR
jgi:hypothetical protein